MPWTPQASVGLYRAEGIPGRRINLNPTVHTTLNYIAGETIRLGTFLWLDTTQDPAVWLNSGTTAPDAFVETVYDYYLCAYSQVGVDTAPAGSRITAINLGEVWAISTTAATVGQTVFANTTDGTVATGAAGSTVAGHVETSWRVKYVSPDSVAEGETGALIMISNQYQDVVAAPAAGGGE